MSPANRPLPVYVRPLLTVRQCEALQRVIGVTVRTEDAATHPDYDLLVQSMGSITDAVMRVKEGKT